MNGRHDHPSYEAHSFAIIRKQASTGLLLLTLGGYPQAKNMPTKSSSVGFALSFKYCFFFLCFRGIYLVFLAVMREKSSHIWCVWFCLFNTATGLACAQSFEESELFFMFFINLERDIWIDRIAENNLKCRVSVSLFLVA